MKKVKINVTKTDLPSINRYLIYLKRIWTSHWLTNSGSIFLEFQEKLQKYLGVKYILPVSNGTLALQVAIKALDLSGEVITTPYTFAATTTSIIWEGCTPVFADIDENTFNIDPVDIERKITKKTVAIMAVHVYGNPCAVEEIQRIATKYNLKVIYDAAHAFGVEYKKKSILNYGDISTLSFHATKTFHTIEGGAIVTSNRKLFEKIKLLINFGIKSEEEVLLPGINAKMNEFQAAMGLCNLDDVNSRIEKRRIIYETYLSNLDKKKIKLQKNVSTKFNFTYMPIVLNSKINRDKVFQTLLDNGIKARKYFFPLTSDFSFFANKQKNLKVARKISDGVLCIPIYPTLPLKDVRQISKIINDSV